MREKWGIQPPFRARAWSQELSSHWAKQLPSVPKAALPASPFKDRQCSYSAPLPSPPSSFRPLLLPPCLDHYQGSSGTGLSPHPPPSLEYPGSHSPVSFFYSVQDHDHLVGHCSGAGHGLTILQRLKTGRTSQCQGYGLWSLNVSSSVTHVCIVLSVLCPL